MKKFHIKKDDLVKVVAGNEKGKTGKVLSIIKDKADFTVTTILSPTEAYLLPVPPNTRIQRTSLAPLNNYDTTRIKINGSG
jgi:ribosomal protein L24